MAGHRPRLFTQVSTGKPGESEMKPMPVGIDIAKNVFQVHYVDQDSGVIVNKRSRGQSSWNTSQPQALPDRHGGVWR